MSAPGAMIALVIKGKPEYCDRFCKRVKILSLAESLGGVESLLSHPAKMTLAAVPREVREARGITDNLLRLSVGIEDVEDLIEDIEQALA